MKTEEITAEYTRKGMNELAEDLGIEDPKSFPNKTKLAEAMISYGFEVEAEENVEKKESKPKGKEVVRLLSTRDELITYYSDGTKKRESK